VVVGAELVEVVRGGADSQTAAWVASHADMDIWPVAQPVQVLQKPSM
jgi:hypothetical protein